MPRFAEVCVLSDDEEAPQTLPEESPKAPVPARKPVLKAKPATRVEEDKSKSEAEASLEAHGKKRSAESEAASREPKSTKSKATDLGEPVDDSETKPKAKAKSKAKAKAKGQMMKNPQQPRRRSQIRSWLQPSIGT